jgi:organic hydroperoxide reductase OsmC/OhrA
LGTVCKVESGYSFGEIIIRSKLTISKPEEEARSLRLLHKAEAVCLVARALWVEPVFEPTVSVRGSASAREAI